jgi:arylsulfatase A-like enzyme
MGVVLKKLEDMGQLDNTIVVFTTDNGAEAISFPDGGVTPFKGQKGEAWEGGYRAPQVVRWPGHIKPGTVKNQLFATLDWLPTFVDIAGGPKGDGLKKQIEAGQYPGIVKTTLDGFDQRDYLEGTSEKSARDYFFYYSARRRRRSATRTGRCTTRCRNRGPRAGSSRWSRSTSRWCRTSSAIRLSRLSASTRRRP